MRVRTTDERGRDVDLLCANAAVACCVACGGGSFLLGDMSLRSDPKKHLYEEKKARVMKEMDSVRRPLPRFQKDSTNSLSAARERATPRAWPLLPFLAVVLCFGFLGTRLWPPSQYVNWADMSKWDPHDKVYLRPLNPKPYFFSSSFRGFFLGLCDCWQQEYSVVLSLSILTTCITWPSS